MTLTDSPLITRAIVAVVFLVPAIGLLLNVRFKIRQFRASEAWNISFRLAVLASSGYAMWVLNLFFEFSSGFMVGWPLIGIALATLGVIASPWGVQGQRAKLAVVNLLLLIVHFTSIVPPN